MKIEVKPNGEKFGLYVNGHLLGESKLQCDAQLAAKILTKAVEDHDRYNAACDDPDYSDGPCGFCAP